MALTKVTFSMIDANIVNVKDFGAVGNGSTDDTAAINLALGQCSGMLLFPPGNYYINGSLTIVNNNTHLIGNGLATLTQHANNTNLIKGNNLTNITIEGLTLIGVGVADTASTLNANGDGPLAQALGIQISNSTNIKIRNNSASFFKNCAIRTRYSSDVWIQNNTVVGTYPDPSIPTGPTASSYQQFGIHIFAEGIAAQGEVYPADPTQIVLHNNKNIFVENNIVSDTAIAYMLFPGYTNVVFQGNSTFGTLTQHSVYAYPFKNTVISNNTLVAVQNAGIKISNNEPVWPENTTITGNTVENYAAPGISIESFDQASPSELPQSRIFFVNMVVSNNAFMSGSDIGIRVEACESAVITNNSIRDYLVVPTSNRPAIELLNSAGIVANNLIVNCDQPAIGILPIFNSSITIDGNVMEDTNLSSASSVISLSPVDVRSFIPNTYYWKNTAFKTSAGKVYQVTTAGITGSTAPTGTGTGITTGTAVVDYVGTTSTIRSKVFVTNNKIFQSAACQAVYAYDINQQQSDVVFTNNITQGKGLDSRISGFISSFHGNNAYNLAYLNMLRVEQTEGTPGRQVSYNAAPLTTAWQPGDIVWNTAPTAGGTVGWVCVTGGTPGTWKTFGAISA